MTTSKRTASKRPPQFAHEWVGANVQALRKMSVPEMTQTDLGNAMTELGFVMDKAKVSRLENGLEKRVDVNKLLALATVLDVIPDRLLRNPDELDAAIFRRLLSRWREYKLEQMRNEARALAIFVELDKLAERSPELAHLLEESKEQIAETEYAAIVEPIAVDSPSYSSYLDYLLTEETSSVFEPPTTTKKGGK
jgi:transcriptional regulator with XRE-family HTH domain